MAPGFKRAAPTVALLAAAATGFVACVVANWPGHFPPDAIDQLAQGRAGVFNFWHPPVMAWLLGLADRIIPGAPLFFVADAALFFAALAALALVRGGSWVVAMLVLVVSASPLVLIYQGLVVKDVLFADAAVGAFAAMAWAARLWERKGARFALSGLALALLTLAALTRQNGVIVAVIGALTLAFVYRAFVYRGRGQGRTRPAGVAGAALAAMALAGGLAEAEFRAHSDHRPEAARQWMTLQVYDLAGAVRRDPRLPLAELHRSAPAIETFIRHDAAPAYDPTRIDPMYRTGGWNSVLAKPNPAIDAQWRALVAGWPQLYLAERWEAFRQVVFTPDIQACAAVLVGVDPAHADWLRAAGLSPRETDKDDWDGDYAHAFLNTPVFAHATYALIALVMLALAVRDVARGAGPELIATIGLLIAALAYAASFAFISIACDYRYLYFLDVAAMAVGVQRAAPGPRASRAAATLSNT